MLHPASHLPISGIFVDGPLAFCDGPLAFFHDIPASEAHRPTGNSGVPYRGQPPGPGSQTLWIWWFHGVKSTSTPLAKDLMLQCYLLFLLGEFWGWNQWTLEASNQSMKRSNLFIKLPVPTYLWLSMHISQPIFQSQDGKVTSFDSKPHSCSLSNFLLWCLVFQQQQLILAAMERSTKSIKKQLSSNVLHGDAMRQATKHWNEGSWLRGFYLPGQFDSMLPNKSDAIIPSKLYLLYCIWYTVGGMNGLAYFWGARAACSWSTESGVTLPGTSSISGRACFEPPVGIVSSSQLRASMGDPSKSFPPRPEAWSNDVKPYRSVLWILFKNNSPVTCPWPQKSQKH